MWCKVAHLAWILYKLYKFLLSVYKLQNFEFSVTDSRGLKFRIVLSLSSDGADVSFHWLQNKSEDKKFKKTILNTRFDVCDLHVWKKYISRTSSVCGHKVLLYFSIWVYRSRVVYLMFQTSFQRFFHFHKYVRYKLFITIFYVQYFFSSFT